MAEVQPPAGSPSLASQEAKRRELQRLRQPADAGTEPDIHAGVLNVPFAGNAALRLANQRNLQIGTPGRSTDAARETAEGGRPSAAAVDQAIGRESREQRASSMLGRVKAAALSPARAVSSRRNDQQGPQKQSRGITDPSFGFGASGKKGPKKVEEQFATMMMGGFIRGCWGALWETFGHTIYIIDILFLAQAASKYLRKYIPGVGEEWIPPPLLKHIPKSTLLPLKLGEIVAMCVVTFLVFILDMMLLSIVAILVGIASSF